jgi:hypothetical protein
MAVIILVDAFPIILIPAPIAEIRLLMFNLGFACT